MPSEKTSDEAEMYDVSRDFIAKETCFSIYDISYKLEFILVINTPDLTHIHTRRASVFQKDCHHPKNFWDCDKKYTVYTRTSRSVSFICKQFLVDSHCISSLIIHFTKFDSK